MGKLICLLGKSSSGKDTIYKRLLEDGSLGLRPFVTYTTRPIREGEREGVEYHFTDVEGLERLRREGKVVEERVYRTVHGPWHYFTVDDGSVSSGEGTFLVAAGTLPAYTRLREYFGADRVKGIMICVDDGVRLQRALDRERGQEKPKYAEMCRRFLTDTEDFSPDKIEAAGVDLMVDNDDLERCLAEVRDWISR